MADFEKHVVETLNFNATVLVFDTADLCAILLSGSMDTHVVAMLREKVNAATVGKRFNYIVDLDGLTYISSTGLGFLMYLLKHQREYVYLSHPKLAVLKPFNLLGIRTMFRYYQTVGDLEQRPEVPAEVLSPFWVEKEEVAAARQRKKWVNILRDYLIDGELTREIQQMSAYLGAAEDGDTITLPAEEKYASVLYKFLDRAFHTVNEFSGEPIDEAAIELIAKELMANAVNHAYGNRPGGTVVARYSTDRVRIEITFTDHGRGFSPAAPDEGGLPGAGLQLLRKIFDELTVGEAPRGVAQGLVLGKGTTLRMVKYVKPRTRPASA
ncbi:MAG: ATP-binding protein [Candidatus Edwardsbacteria bacterium]|jgi:anti-anti-sigma factor|nr:ATP-binding protein [Candidatus Edwardsbacteria bacterium]